MSKSFFDSVAAGAISIGVAVGTVVVELYFTIQLDRWWEREIDSGTKYRIAKAHRKNASRALTKLGHVMGRFVWPPEKTEDQTGRQESTPAPRDADTIALLDHTLETVILDVDVCRPLVESGKLSWEAVRLIAYQMTGHDVGANVDWSAWKSSQLRDDFFRRRKPGGPNSDLFAHFQGMFDEFFGPNGLKKTAAGQKKPAPSEASAVDRPDTGPIPIAAASTWECCGAPWPGPGKPDCKNKIHSGYPWSDAK